MSGSRLQYLFNSYLDRSITSSEKEEMIKLIARTENDELVKSFIDKVISETGEEMDISDTTAEAILDAILQADKETVTPVHRVHFLKTSWFRYAAIFILIIGAAVVVRVFTNHHDSVATTNDNKRLQKDVEPGTNRAVLTVGNNKINLATNKTGIAVSNTITYNDGEKIADVSQLLQLTTPRGGQYQALLPDGTKVWLNAASSIKFPSKFIGNERNIEITGEAYLEVAGNLKQPFTVTTGKTIIQVLGTSFNINAYPDEEVVKTTLISGSVKVISRVTDSAVVSSDQQHEVVLKSGEQAQISGIGAIRLTHALDVQQVLAWKNNLFSFSNADIKTVMRQLSRWYDVDISYEGAIPARKFEGKIQRDLNLADVLEALQKSDVHFRIEGKKIVVTP